PFARELAFAADALLQREILVGFGVLSLKAARPVVGTSPFRAILAKFGANLLFLFVSHQKWLVAPMQGNAEITGRTCTSPASSCYTGRLGSLIWPALSSRMSNRPLCSSFGSGAVFLPLTSKPARSSNDCFIRSAAWSSTGGGPTAPRSCGE